MPIDLPVNFSFIFSKYDFPHPMVTSLNNSITLDFSLFSAISSNHSSNAVPAFGWWRKIRKVEGPKDLPCSCSPRLFSSRWKSAMGSSRSQQHSWTANVHRVFAE